MIVADEPRPRGAEASKAAKDESDSRKRCRPRRYAVREGACDPHYREALQLKVTEVLGTSPVIAAGENYIVRGAYVLTGEDVVSIGAVVNGRSEGHYEDLRPGSGQFEVRATILELRDGSPRQLSLLVGDKDDRERGGPRATIELQG